MDGDLTGPDATPAPGPEATVEPGADLGAELRDMWEELDPVPAALAERVVFALEVDAFTHSDLELDLMRLQQPRSVGPGARGEPVRTVTFGSESLTVMLAISDVAGGHRVDGWVAPGGRRDIEVRTSAGSSTTRCDETGRFVLPLVPPGHFQLVLAELGGLDRTGEPGEDTEADGRAENGSVARDGTGRPAGSVLRVGSGGRATVTPALTL